MTDDDNTVEAKNNSSIDDLSDEDDYYVGEGDDDRKGEFKRGFFPIHDDDLPSKPFKLILAVYTASRIDPHRRVDGDEFWWYFLDMWTEPGILRTTYTTTGSSPVWNQCFSFPVDGPARDEEAYGEEYVNMHVVREGFLQGRGTSTGLKVVGNLRVKVPPVVMSTPMKYTMELERPLPGGEYGGEITFSMRLVRDYGY